MAKTLIETILLLGFIVGLAGVMWNAIPFILKVILIIFAITMFFKKLK
ncbi:MAG: hypothetical protein IJ963_01335 [Phascolarctobacterium sp.]|nr:hypothetical protein [Phascolarctobacterium sp.]